MHELPNELKDLMKLGNCSKISKLSADIKISKLRA